MATKYFCFALIFITILSLNITPGWPTERIQLVVGESKVIPVNYPKKVAVGDPKVADIKVLSPKEILVNAKSVGVTTLIVWDSSGRQETTQIIVLASTLEITMIRVDVQVLEVNKTAMQDSGLNWDQLLKGSDYNPSNVVNPPLVIQEKSIPPLFQVGSFERLSKITATLDMLVQKGYARVLAKPSLITISGGKASFNSGGEIPVPYYDGDKVSISWKPYGVSLEIEPTADSLGNINAEIKAEVSQVDWAVARTNTPGVRTRWAKTKIYVKRGGTIVIGGLIKNEEQKYTKQVPVLGDLPVLGKIFRKTHTENLESELVIFVTPSIVGHESQ